VHSRRPETSDEAVAFIGAGRAVAALADMGPADAWMICVPDDRIATVAEALTAGAAVCAPALAFHCSGFQPASSLRALRAAGWRIASAHPALSFADPEAAAQQFPGTPCALEGDADASRELHSAFTAIGGQCFPIAQQDKALYHAAAVFLSNFLPVHAAIADELWQRVGVPPDLIARLRSGFLGNAVENVLTLGARGALTGPAARGDFEVVEAEAAALALCAPVAGDAYRALSVLAARLAQTGRTGT
jgi:predicted short-subunit dehydrogenase-like oxidoreductase (DUF2520 family)